MFDTQRSPAAEPWEDAALLLGRVLLALIFLESGFGKLMGFDGFTAMLVKQEVPMPQVLAVLGVAAEFGGAILVVTGLKTRYAALLLMGFTVAATLIAHRFWEAPDSARALQHIQFMKNVAILGGFVLLFARGPGAYSLDGWLARAGDHRRRWA